MTAMGDHPIGNPEERAALFVAGGLVGEELRAYEEHLQMGCGACARELSAWNTVIPALESLRATRVPSVQLKHRVLAAVDALLEPANAQKALDQLLIRRTDEGEWKELGYPGITMRMLHVDKQRGCYTALVRMAEGATFPPHRHLGAEECLVLQGDLKVGDDILKAGDYLRSPPSYLQPEQSSPSGCLLMLMSPVK